MDKSIYERIVKEEPLEIAKLYLLQVNEYLKKKWII